MNLQLLSDSVDERATVRIFKFYFTFGLRPQPYRRGTHRVALETGQDVPMDMWLDIAETFVIQFRRIDCPGNSASDCDGFIEQRARICGRHQVDFLDVAR